MSMNKDEIKGRVEEAKGSINEAAGTVVGDKKNLGKVQGTLGDVRQDVKDTPR